MWEVTGDGSVIDHKKKVLLFSAERFISDICLGDNCFICGASPKTHKFNNEHVLPAWLLRKYDLFDKSVTLPNGTQLRYGSYTVPCCKDCNDLMGKKIEQPISQIVNEGTSAITEFLQTKEGRSLFFTWIGLIYLKTHLKDRQLRLHRDTRLGDSKIADNYEWAQLHHIHCVVRSFYTGCVFSSEALGSFFALQIKSHATDDEFDYGDLYLAQTALVRFGDLALFAVLNDSGGALGYFDHKLSKITAPINEVQAREIMAELAFLNLHLNERPEFQTEFDLEKERCEIVAHLPQLALAELDLSIRGKFMDYVLQGFKGKIHHLTMSDSELMNLIRAGRFTFLFDDQGRFIEQTGLSVD